MNITLQNKADSQLPQVSGLLPPFARKGRKTVTLLEAAALLKTTGAHVLNCINWGFFEGERKGMGRMYVDYKSLMGFLENPKGDDA